MSPATTVIIDPDSTMIPACSMEIARWIGGSSADSPSGFTIPTLRVISHFLFKLYYSQQSYTSSYWCFPGSRTCCTDCLGKEKEAVTIQAHLYLREKFRHRPCIHIFHQVRTLGREQLAYLLHLLISRQTHHQNMMSLTCLLQVHVQVT